MTTPAVGAASSRVAVVQFAPSANASENLTRIRALTAACRADGAQVVVFPEYSQFFTSRMGGHWTEASEPLDGPFASGLSGIAADLGVHLVAGMLERVAGDRFSNTLVAFAPDGALAATYRKLHLYDAFGQRESDFARAGEIAPPQTFRSGPLVFGLQTCYDLRFPEVTRRLVDAGADVVLVPSDWVPGPRKKEQWKALLTARSIENTAFVAAADHPAPSGVGASAILDPTGAELAVLGDDEDTAVAELHRERLDEVRRANPALELRRFKVVER